MSALPTATPLPTSLVPGAAPVLPPPEAAPAAMPLQSAFSALWLGLCAAAPAPGRSGEPAGESLPGSAELPGAAAALAAGALTAMPDLPLPEPGIPPDGESLPDPGTELPPADAQALIAVIVASAAATGVDQPADAPAQPAQPASPVPPGAASAAAPVVTPLPPGTHAAAATDAPAPPPDSGAELPPVPAAALEPHTVGDEPAGAALEAARRDDAVPRLAAHAAEPIVVEHGNRPEPAPHAARTRSPRIETLGLEPLAQAGAVAAPAAARASQLPDTFAVLPRPGPHAEHASLGQALGERLLLMADKGLQSATIRLQPDHLGPVEIRLRVDADGASQVQFSAQHAHARDALEAAIPRLRELFADHGLDLRQANVDAGRGGFAHAGPGHERDRGGAREAEPAALETSIHWPARRPERRLDVLV